MSIKSVWPCTYTAARKTPSKEHRCIAPLGSRELQGDGPRSAHPLFWGLIAGVTSKAQPYYRFYYNSALGLRAYRRGLKQQKGKQCKVQLLSGPFCARSFLRTVADALKPVALNLARPEGCDATMLLTRRLSSLSSHCIRTRTPRTRSWRPNRLFAHADRNKRLLSSCILCDS